MQDRNADFSEITDGKGTRGATEPAGRGYPGINEPERRLIMKHPARDRGYLLARNFPTGVYSAKKAQVLTMNIEQWLEQYGYFAVFIGVFLEGPLTLALAGFLAYQGYLSITVVLLTSFVAAFLYIEIVFFIGMGTGQYLMSRWPVIRRYYERISALLDRYEKIFILFFRFVYGTHTLAPLVVGMGRFKPAYFTLLNILGAAIWTITMFLIGYFFGHVFRMLIEDIKHYEKLIVLFLVAMMLVYYLIRRLIWHKTVVDKH